MGNACAKNAADQVKPNKPAAPPIDTSALDEAELLNEKLRKQKRDLEDELAKWRKVQDERMKGADEELSSIQAESSALLSVGGTSGEMRSAAEQLLQQDMTEADAEEVRSLREKRIVLKEYLDAIAKENMELDVITQRTEAGAQELDDLLGKLEVHLEDPNREDFESAEAARARNLSVIAELYRPVPQPESLADCIDQSRIDCAECSSQTVRNLKALAHHWATGDVSWYQTRPLRGVVCNSLKMGNVPHDPWNCELCHYLDNSDIPLFV